MPLRNLQTVVAKGSKGFHHNFNDVVFVIDDLISPLDDVIYTGLSAANQEGYHKLLLPTIRMGVMAGVVEKTPKEALTHLANGIQRFATDNSDKLNLEILTIVIDKNQPLVNAVGEAFY